MDDVVEINSYYGLWPRLMAYYVLRTRYAYFKARIQAT
jgi:hypothetical protein